MIRSIAMHNFVHFDKEQRLVFEEGTNFIIGGNSTGKTAIFELIRRCYSNKKNSTTTSVSNTNELAYAICHFKIPKNYPSFNSKEQQPKEILAGIFIKKRIDTEFKKAKRSVAKTESSQVQAHGFEYYKVICSMSTRASVQTFVKKFKGHYGCNTEDLKGDSIHCKEINIETTVLDRVKNCGTRSHIKEFYQLIENSFVPSVSTNTFEKAMKSMSAIYDWLEKGYVGILPMRSIGPIQWTNSIKLNKHKNRISNYSKANQNSEILLRLLGNNKVNKEKEKNFIDILYILTNSLKVMEQFW
ncbi:unnamed protein product [Mytilus edulis]|uniref:Rad50/SbcC-type AAA domain-containing protein n=1 Tax=Mytilus edulis TaxID=6550 RepID=A0A8S3T3G5_MYTED|nr:unnamed protein product [Mytilus edulis]